MNLLFFLILLGLGYLAFCWIQKYYRVNRLYQEAKDLEGEYFNNSPNLDKLKQALAVYKQCQQLIASSTYLKAIDCCQQKLDDRQTAEELVAIAKDYQKQGFYDRALEKLIKAERLFTSQKISFAIEECQAGIVRQTKYEDNLATIKVIASQGDFKNAINLSQINLAEFHRQDGVQLLTKLNLVVEARKIYKSGLIAEQNRQISQAIALYQKALAIIPEYLDCRLRLAIIHLADNPQQTIEYLQDIKQERANYIRGFAYNKLGDWQQANREWRSLETPQIKEQRYWLKKLVQRNRLQKIQRIERAIEATDLILARDLSYDFEREYGGNSIVTQNLQNHLQPILDKQLWQSQDWHQTTQQMQQIWLKKLDIQSLHNWAIATYHQAQIYPDKLADFITASMTAIANLKLDPLLKNIPWLKEKKTDLSLISQQLKQTIEMAIEDLKQVDIQAYFSLRDIYRRDLVMLSLKEQNSPGVTTQQQLTILPNCYQILPERERKTQLPAAVWGALYTEWGMAVAACHRGDISRAIEIEPQQNPTSPSDRYALAYVGYHKGLHYLQNQYWRKSIEPLKLAQSLIKDTIQWYEAIDRVCQTQRRQIDSFSEHLEFSEFWYFLIESHHSKSYYLEYQALKVGFEVDTQKIDFQAGLAKLKQLQELDRQNPFIISTIQTLEVNLELESINKLWQSSEYEQVIEIAKLSHHNKVRYAVAEVCLEVVLHILQTEELTHETLNSIQKITHWAYELCPFEESFQPIYNHLKRVGVYN